MLQYAERMLRKDPKKITFFGPLVTYSLTLMLGTGHAVYTIMPIIGDIALKIKYVLKDQWLQPLLPLKWDL